MLEAGLVPDEVNTDLPNQEEAERLCEALQAQTALAEGRAAAFDGASADMDAAAVLKDADLDVRRGRRERMRAKHEGYLRDIAATVAKLSAAGYRPIVQTLLTLLILWRSRT